MSTATSYRPRRQREPYLQFNILIPVALRERLDAYGRRVDRNASDIAREAITAFLDLANEPEVAR